MWSTLPSKVMFSKWNRPSTLNTIRVTRSFMHHHLTRRDRRSLLTIMKLVGIAISFHKTIGLKTSCWQFLIWNIFPGLCSLCGMATTCYKLGIASLDATYSLCPWWWCLVAYLCWLCLDGHLSWACWTFDNHDRHEQVIHELL
jgi:hypothetical protein